MSLSDPLGDMLTRIRNGQMRGKESVLMPASRFRGNVLDVLQREGYIKGFKNMLMVNQLLKAYLEFLNPAGGFILILKICKETSMDLALIFYRLLKAFFQTVKLELKVWEEKFYAKFSRRFF